MIVERLTEKQKEAFFIGAIFRERPSVSLPQEIVYFIRSGRYVKIGRTGRTRLRERMSDLQIGNPEPLEHLGSILCWDAAYVENWLHETLAEDRVRGEWYVLTAGLAAYIEDRAEFRNPRRDLIGLALQLEAER